MQKKTIPTLQMNDWGRKVKKFPQDLSLSKGRTEVGGQDSAFWNPSLPQDDYNDVVHGAM
jgi:hypothetical protein